jgi:hypothetical protein
VDVISTSLGSTGSAEPFDMDIIAVGAFSAVRKGILVSASAGNSGPGESTARNVAPWLLTVRYSCHIRRRQEDPEIHSKQEYIPHGDDLFQGTVIGPTPPSPRMASFSSRGPNVLAPEIL